MKRLFSLGGLPKLRPSGKQLVYAGGLGTAGLLLLFRIGSLPAHLSQNELAGQQVAILQNPLDAPYKCVEWLALHALGYGTAATRITSVFFALVALVLFFMTVLRWHNQRTAWIVSALLATSGWFLHTGRLGLVNILWFLLPLALISFTLWLERTKRHALALFAGAVLLGAALFVPAAIWFLLVCIVLSWRALREHFSWLSKREIAGVWLVVLIFAGLLAFSLVRHTELLKPWLGLPQTWPHAKVALKVWGESLAVYPFVYGPGNAELWLGHVPILDVFTSFITLVGAWFYARHITNRRTQIMLAFLVLGSILTALNGTAGMNFIVPVLYLLAATGLTFFLHKWFSVFPRNPVARGAGVVLVALAVVCVVSYHISEYFIAWQHNPKTAAIFGVNLVK